MRSGVRRSVEVDFIRGVVLIVIAIDHVSGSALAKFTLHGYAFCDAAEVFVFLAGYASAAGYEAIAAKHGHDAARLRFVRRSEQIYRAYLVTAGLMLGCGALMTALHLHTPMIAQTEWPLFARQPLAMAGEIASFRHQPYLAAVLPMYAVFALRVSVVAAYVRGMPVGTSLVSLAMWLLAPLLGPMLPSASGNGWGFNPFAWQLMFVAGMLVRLHPVPAAFHASRTGAWLTRISIGIALAFAVTKLALQPQPMPGVMKQNLASIRVIGFAVIAWPVAVMVQRGWLRGVAHRARFIVNVGQQGVACFVVGAVASLLIDTALRASEPHRVPFFAGLAGDVLVFAVLVGTAAVARRCKRRVAVSRVAETMGADDEMRTIW